MVLSRNEKMWPFDHSCECGEWLYVLENKLSINKSYFSASIVIKLNFNLIHLLIETYWKWPSYARYVLVVGKNIGYFLLLRSELEHNTKYRRETRQQEFWRRYCYTNIFVMHLELCFISVLKIDIKICLVVMFI